MRPLRLAALMAVAAAALWALVGHGLVNYDTLYALDWGRDLGHGRLPDYGVPVAPTPHPLATLLGLALSPVSSLSDHGVHGEAATDVMLVVAFLSLALAGWMVYRLGRRWFNAPTGVLAALIFLTRQPVLDYGARAYVDIPYAALVLGALLCASPTIRTDPGGAGRPPGVGAPQDPAGEVRVLALLAVAGLLRPEAWLFAAAYVLWLIARGEREPTRLALLAGLAAAAPVAWLAFDLVVTGDALHSLSGTRNTARVLGRLTGITHVPGGLPPRLGEIVREPVLLGAAVGGALSLAWLRARALPGVLAAVLALAAFSVLAAAGLSILTRYLLVSAALLCIFAAAGALGWLELATGDRRRRWWQAVGAVVAVALLAFVPAQYDRLSRLRDTLERQAAIQGDLAQLVRAGTIGVRCPPLVVPNHRPVPLLALWLDVRPASIIGAQEQASTSGSFITPATPAVARDYILDPRDPVQRLAPAPVGLRPVGQDRSWRVLTRC
jgi:hypothetical protein